MKKQLLVIALIAISLSNVLAQTKIASWPFSGNANDATGNGHDGQLRFGPQLTTDRFGNSNSAYQFDGINDYIKVPHSNDFNVNSFTISGWVYATAFTSNYEGFINKKDSITNVSIIKGFSTSSTNQGIRMSAKLTDGTATEPGASNPINLNEWSHIVYVFDQGTVKYYLNGVLVLTNTAAAGKDISTNTADITIGVTYWFPSFQFNKYYWKGKIDDIDFYSGALSDCEVSGLYNSSNLVASWPFNGNANDESGNGHDGQLRYGPQLTTDRFGNANSAYEFDGINDYIKVPHSNEFDVNTFTISGWVYPNAFTSNYEGFINKKDSITNVTIIKGFSTSSTNQGIRMSAKLTDGTATEPGVTTPINLNEWSHIVYVFDQGTVKYYLNGELVLTNTAAAGKDISTNTADITIGVTYWFPSFQFNKYYWNGKIDDIKFYNSALSDCEVSSLYTPAEVTGIFSTKNNLEADIVIYPNPSKEEFMISIGENLEDASIVVMDEFGKIQDATIEFNNSKGKVSLAGKPSGIYFIKITNKDRSVSKKVIKF